MKKFFLIAGIISLTACDSAGFITGVAVDKVRQGADTTARTAIQGPCAITLGAAERELTPRERELAVLLAKTSCGKSNGDGLTEEEKQSLPEK